MATLLTFDNKSVIVSKSLLEKHYRNNGNKLSKKFLGITRDIAKYLKSENPTFTLPTDLRSLWRIVYNLNYDEWEDTDITILWKKKGRKTKNSFKNNNKYEHLTFDNMYNRFGLEYNVKDFGDVYHEDTNDEDTFKNFYRNKGSGYTEKDFNPEYDSDGY